MYVNIFFVLVSSDIPIIETNGYPQKELINHKLFFCWILSGEAVWAGWMPLGDFHPNSVVYHYIINYLNNMTRLGTTYSVTKCMCTYCVGMHIGCVLSVNRLFCHEWIGVNQCWTWYWCYILNVKLYQCKSH